MTQSQPPRLSERRRPRHLKENVVCLHCGKVGFHRIACPQSKTRKVHDAE